MYGVNDMYMLAAFSYNEHFSQKTYNGECMDRTKNPKAKL